MKTNLKMVKSTANNLPPDLLTACSQERVRGFDYLIERARLSVTMAPDEETQQEGGGTHCFLCEQKFGVQERVTLLKLGLVKG